MARLLYTLVKVPLDDDIDADDTTITFTAPLREFGTDDIPTISSPDTLTLRVGMEIMHVTAYTSGAYSATVLREQEGSTATAHDAGDIARHVATDLDLGGGGGGSGVVESVVAGPGITVDDTDPANPVVSASGGGGAPEAFVWDPVAEEYVEGGRIFVGPDDPTTEGYTGQAGDFWLDPTLLPDVDLATTGKGFVNHGATASTARPIGYASVEWFGTVEPENAVDGDTWWDPS